MAHEAHHDAHHSLENKPKTALNSSFWFVLILALLFISAVNFVKVNSGEEHEGAEEAQTEHVEHASGEEKAEHEGQPVKEEAGEANEAAATDSSVNTEEAHH